MVENGRASSTVTGTGTGSGAPAIGGCNNNWTLWSAGTRVQYDFTKTLYIGVEFLYQRLDTATLGTCNIASNPSCPQAQIANTAPPGNGLVPGFSVQNQNVISLTARIHKDFLP